jgi:hypothetical protein
VKEVDQGVQSVNTLFNDVSENNKVSVIALCGGGGGGGGVAEIDENIRKLIAPVIKMVNHAAELISTQMCSLGWLVGWLVGWS